MYAQYFKIYIYKYSIGNNHENLITNLLSTPYYWAYIYIVSKSFSSIIKIISVKYFFMCFYFLYKPIKINDVESQLSRTII